MIKKKNKVIKLMHLNKQSMN